MKKHTESRHKLERAISWASKDGGRIYSLLAKGSTIEQWNELRKASFEKGKYLSDFVGMLVRLGFAWLAFIFFKSETVKVPFLFEGWILGSCSVFALGMFIVLLYRVMLLVLLYYLELIPITRSGWNCYVLVALSVVSSGTAAFAVMRLAQAIAKSSAMVH